MKPASKWHLKTTRTRLISGDGGGGVADGVWRSVAASSGDEAPAIQAVLPVARSVSRNFRLRIFVGRLLSRGRSFEDVDRVQPGFDEFRPVSNRLVRGAETPSVAAVGVDVQLSGNFCVFQREEIDSGVFDVNG